MEFPFQLTDNLTGGHLYLADDFIFPGKILVKLS